MSDIDHVFARFSTAGVAETPSRQTVTIPARGTRGSRVVQVVHLRHGARAVDEAPARHASDVGGAAWGEEISGKGSMSMPAMPEPEAPAAPQPVVHVMPAWEARPVETQALPAGEPEEPVTLVVPKVRLPSGNATARRRVADPFNAADEGANCMRCGYLVEPAREKRGLLTCAECGYLRGSSVG